MGEQICIFGCGYVGLAAAAVLADLGHHVVGVDRDAARVLGLNEGRPPFREPGLEELIRSGLGSGRLSFTLDGAVAAGRSGVAMIAVGTPPSAGGAADLSQVEAVVRLIAAQPAGCELVVVKSTVPPGTAGQLQASLPSREVVSHPQFLRQGSALADMLHPPRRVVGARSPEAAERLIRLYARAPEVPFVRTDPTSAELAKYAGNGFLAAKVSFVNALARLCETVGGDIQDVVRVMGLDSRIGPDFLRPSIGFGGSCLPKDTLALVTLAREHGLAFEPGEATLAVNAAQPGWFAGRVLGALPPSPVVAAWGITFKAGTDDTRSSAALAVIDVLQAEGATVQAYDPLARAVPAGVRQCGSALAAAAGADAVVILTEWPEFQDADWQQVAAVMRGRQVFDGRNLIDPDRVAGTGLTLVPLGRGAALKEERVCGPW